VRANDLGAFIEGDKQLAVAPEELMIKRLRIENPIFVDAVLLVLGEFESDVAIRCRRA
jgi:hypothetical protein